MSPKKPDITYSEEETIARAEAALKRMLATPHRAHSEMKLGKRKAKASLKRERGKGKPTRPSLD
jgi:hypothetical protein